MAPPLNLHVALALAIALAALALARALAVALEVVAVAANSFGNSGTLEYSTFHWLFFFFYSIH